MKNIKDKDQIRKLKRTIKRAGNKKVRSTAKKEIANNPEEAHLTQIDYNGLRSKDLNGFDYDATRKK